MIDVKEEQIRLLAKQLKIPTFAEYKNVLSDCAPDMDFSDLLLTLMASETAARQENQTRRRLKAAGFPVQKSLDDFDTSQLNPSVSPVFLNELASCQFIEQKKNIVMIGNPGRGKTHIAIALGIKACLQGYHVLFKNASTLSTELISRRSAKTAQDRRIAHTSQNPTLLAGIVYCAHCGAKMSGFMHTDRYKLADGSIREKVQPKYNCFQRGQRNKGGRDCDGQALYLAERVDAIVLKIVEEVFEQIRDTPYSQVAENRIRQESNLQKTKRAAAEKKIKAAQHALERFEGEILKCLDGTSNFTEDMIAKQIRRYQQELDDAKAEYAELQNARLNEAAEIRKLRTYYDDFKGWAEEFDTAPLEMKRMILSHLIDRVEVGRKYQVIVKFNMKYRQFLECTAETYNTEIGA